MVEAPLVLGRREARAEDGGLPFGAFTQLERGGDELIEDAVAQVEAGP